ncbi:tagatose-6-phosphate kinase [Bacillus manliponensis]|uniref:1-phosphofructokinase n=1 Tax=Bacillus manliponensis TaxID=574376 RepID=A0A073JWV4_9BACI|nr:1-phosphofructokinase [Bacillus manliponensis]KEK18775.1 tagatose-6-phosphate kinase [Bacillus manliponensis]
MIATITLNPSIDMRYELDELRPHEIHRTNYYEKTAGGKGVNVSRILRLLGEEVIGTGLLGGQNGEFIREEIQKLRITDEFISIEEETRHCLAFVTKSSSVATEILEAGPVITEQEVATFIRKYETILQQAQFIVASGSLPRGVPNSFYKSLVEKATAHGKKFILDTSHRALSYGIQGKPFLIKPNRQELANLLQKENITYEEILQAAKGICRAGIRYVLVSLGREGAILVTEHDAFRAILPKVHSVNAVGSGDAMVAGITYAFANGYEVEDALRLASACGMANAMERQTGYIERENVERLYKKITIIRE